MPEQTYYDSEKRHGNVNMTRRRLLGLGVLAGVSVLTACAIGTESKTPDTQTTESKTSDTQGAETNAPEQVKGLDQDPARKLTAARIISTFENSTTEIKYDYAEILGEAPGTEDDGRGITAGRAGFTSGTGDLLEVVQRYAHTKPTSELAKYVPALKAVNGTDSVEGLDGFAKAWARASHEDATLNKIQDAVVDEMYFTPAMQAAEAVGIKSSLGQLIMWDTIIQHGGGTDPDSLTRIVMETKQKSGMASDKEGQWLDEFLTIRRAHLEHAYDPATREAWRESVDRVEALRSILDSGNMALNLPLRWTVYGDSFELKTD